MRASAPNTSACSAEARRLLRSVRLRADGSLWRAHYCRPGMSELQSTPGPRELMKIATAFSVPIATAPGYVWRWRASDYAEESSQYFLFYADCLADAERHGYKVRQVQPRGEMA